MHHYRSFLDGYKQGMCDNLKQKFMNYWHVSMNAVIIKTKMRKGRIIVVVYLLFFGEIKKGKS